MSSENHHIHRYQYEIHSRFTDEGVSDNALLYLYGREKQLLAVVAFVTESQSLNAPTMAPEGHVTVELHARMLPTLIDLLRNENPVSIGWNLTEKVVRISSQKEPVGEQELKRMFSFLYI